MYNIYLAPGDCITELVCTFSRSLGVRCGVRHHALFKREALAGLHLVTRNTPLALSGQTGIGLVVATGNILGKPLCFMLW